MTPARAVDGMSSEFHKIAPHSPVFEQFQLDVVRKADSSVIGVKRRTGSCTDASFPYLVNAPEGHRPASLLSNAEYQRHVLSIS